MKLFLTFFISTLMMLVFAGCTSEENKKDITSNTLQKIVVTKDSMDIKEDNPLITYGMDGRQKFSVAIDGEESIVTRQIGALASVKNSYEKINQKLLEKRLSRNYILKCSSCHDHYANGVVGPSLLTKSTDDIYEMIYAYKTATKVNVLMKYLVSQMDKKEVMDLAQEISNFNKEYRSENENRTNN